MRTPLLYIASLLRFLTVLICVAVACLGLLRLGVWALGRDTLHEDVVRSPEVFVWTVEAAEFGGLSALIMAPDGASVLAGSDHGHFIAATILRAPNGRIIGITDPVLTQISLASGKPPTNFKMDLEGLSALPDGRIAQAFEGFVRIETVQSPDARPTATHRWDQFVELFGNQAFEALATLPSGRLLAITERHISPGMAGTMIYDGTAWSVGRDLPVPDGFALTGADVGPDGCLYVLDRRYGVASGFTSRVRRLSLRGADWEQTTLYVTPPAHLGNGEGLSSWRDADGNVVLDLVTDNGFLPFSPTRLIELRLRPGEGCTLEF